MYSIQVNFRPSLMLNTEMVLSNIIDLMNEEALII